MSMDCSLVSLSSLGVLRVQGADALSFLQGQLSNDVTLLQQPRAVLAGYHNPQGRVVALLRLAALDDGDVVAALPRELVPQVAQRLSRFVLRAKVKLADDSAHWQVHGLIGAPRPCALALPDAVNGTALISGTLVIRIAAEPARWLLLARSGAASLLGELPSVAPVIWQRLAIAAGEAQVYGATSEEFVAQMLNLDALGGIAFDKGCYIGQEVIARAHYRGRVKRRLQRFVTHAPGLLKPADAGVLEDGRSFKVVDAVLLDDGRCEFLAVAPLSAASEGSESAAHAPLAAQTLSLPYPLPE
jgi:tRNA-modifying protein YgfZ